MICKNCSAEFSDENSCPYCGTPASQPTQTAQPFQSAQPTSPTPDYPPTYPGPAKQPKKKKGLVIFIVFLCVLVVAMASVILYLILGNPDNNNSSGTDGGSDLFSSIVPDQSITASVPDDGCDHSYDYGICSLCGDLNEDALAVAKYLENYLDYFSSTFETSFASSSGLNCRADISTLGTGMIVDVYIEGLDNVTEAQKQELQSSYDSASSTFESSLQTIQIEIPQLDYMTYYVREDDGDLLATFTAGK